MALLDETGIKIISILQNNCRASLTEIAKEVSLSVDSVKKRVDKLQKSGLFFNSIQMRPRHFGYPYVVDIKIKLQNYTKARADKFVEECINNSRIVELISISGEWDFTIVMIAKDHEDLAEQTDNIREKFRDIIRDWSESLTTVVYKFEKYNMRELLK